MGTRMTCEATMTLRYMTCSFCGGAIDIPGNYLKATIACPFCRGMNNRSAGEAAPLVPELPRLTPFPQARPVTNSYPTPFTGFTRVEQKSRWWLIPLVAGLAACLVIAGLLAIPFFTGDADSAPTEGWYEYTSVAGGFSVKFPQKPTEKTQPVETELGPRVARRAIGTSDSLVYEVMFFDLGSKPEEEYIFDAEKGLGGIAKLAHGKVVSHKRIKLFGLDADRGVVENDSGYRSEAVMLRIHNRVWVIICARVSAGVELNFEPFLHTFKLDEKWLPAQLPARPGTVAQPQQSSLKISTLQNPQTTLVGDYVELSVAASGGMAPFAWEWSGFPSNGLEAMEGANAVLTLRGKLMQAQQWSFHIQVHDSENATASATLWLNVVAVKDAGTFVIDNPRVHQDDRYVAYVSLVAPLTIKSLRWRLDPTQLPRGLTYAKNTDPVSHTTKIEGTPRIQGEFKIEISCEAEFTELPGHSFVSFTAFTLIVVPPVSPRCEFRNLLGKRTLFLLDDGPYVETARAMLQRAMGDLMSSFPEDKQLGICRMGRSEWQRVGSQAKPMNSTEAVKLVDSMADWGNGYDYSISLCRALSGVTATSTEGYDRIILVTPLREIDVVSDLVKLQSEFDRISKIEGVSVTIVAVTHLLPHGFADWLVEKKITLIHQVP